MQTLTSMYGASTPMMNPQLQTLQWLCSLSPHQQALLLPLLQQNTPLSSPMFVPSKEEDMMAGMNRESLFSLNHLQQSPLSYCLHENQMTESTQENSPKIAYYNLGLGMNDCFSLQDKPVYATSTMLNNNLPNMSLIATSKKIKKQKNQNNSAKKCDSVLTNIRKESCDSVMSGLKSPTLSSAKQNSNNSNNNMNLLGDDKNIIHINFTKNLLKSFRRYCEYFHKNNQQLLQQIKTEFETNHMNNQLLVHFMTNPLTMEYFQLFVDGPAQKWVKEQSRLKKQDQQLELIEICRQRLFEKIKVKKYCDSVTNTIQVEDNQVSQSPNLTPMVAPVVPSTKKTTSLTARPIYSTIQQQPQTARKSALSSSSSSSSSSCAGSDDSYGEEMNDQKNNQSSKNHRKEECDLEEEDDDSSQSRQINRNSNTLNNNNNKQINNFPQVTFEAKIEEIEQAIKIEDDN